MLEIDSTDTRHMFWEEMRRLFFALKEIEPEEFDEEMMNDFPRAMDRVLNVLYRFELRRRKRVEPPKELRL
jgi:hypothetical protein